MMQPSLLVLSLAALIGIFSVQASELPVALETTPANYHQIPREYRLDGTVEAVNRSTLTAQTSGQIESVHFDVDNFVEKGTLIIMLRDTEQQAKVAQAQAELTEAKARLIEATDEHSRTRELFQKKLTSQSNMDKAKAGLEAARAQVQAAQAGERQAMEQLSYTRIKAPYSGLVVERHVEVGEIATPGTPLMSGISLDKLRVRVDIPQNLIRAVRQFRQASIELPDDKRIPAADITIFPFAQTGSNTFQVRLDLPENIQEIFPGMFLRTTFVTGEQKLLLIPLQAVVYRSEVTAAYVVSDTGRVAMRHLRTGHKTDNGQIIILAGLDAGEQVAMDPIAAGQRLKIQASRPMQE